jgi:hypothetical protein
MAVLMRHLALVLVITLFSFRDVAAQDDESIRLYEEKIKAGLIYNFIKYTEWPDDRNAENSSPIEVCVFGQDPFDGYLQPMAGRTVRQRRINIRHIGRPAEVQGCHLLFIGASERDRWPQLRRLLADKSILTVSDFEGFSDAGGMIQFGSDNNRIKVELNSVPMQAAHLRVYDKMLKLVKIKGSAPRDR